MGSLRLAVLVLAVGLGQVRIPWPPPIPPPIPVLNVTGNLVGGCLQITAPPRFSGLAFYRNGIRQAPGVDYTLTFQAGKPLSICPTLPFAADDTLLADYWR
jgi:hypothetical protein